MKLTKQLLIIAIIFFWSLQSIEFTIAQSRSNTQIILEHSDTLRNVGDVRHLIGNVRLKRLNSYLSADKVLFDQNTGMADLMGNVRLIEPKRKVSATQMTYFETSGNFEAMGNVDFLEADSVRILAATAKYNEFTKDVELFGNFRLYNLTDETVITGDLGQWNPDTKIAHVRGRSVYTSPYSNDERTDTLVIKSERIEFYRESNSALFIGNVKLNSDDFSATADTLFHHPDSNYTILYGKPVIWRTLEELSGGRIAMYFEDNNLKNIHIFENAIVYSTTSEAQSMFDRLSGNVIKISMIDDSTRMVNVIGDGEGVYHIWGEDGDYQGVNMSAANKIEISVVSNVTRSIGLIGGVAGGVYPPGMEPKVKDKFKAPQKLRAGD